MGDLSFKVSYYFGNKLQRIHSRKIAKFTLFNTKQKVFVLNCWKMLMEAKQKH